MDSYAHTCSMMGWNKYEYHRVSQDFVLTHAELLKTVMKTLESKYNDALIVEIKRLPVGTESIFRKAYDGYIHILKPKIEKRGFFNFFRSHTPNPNHIYQHYTSIVLKYRESKPTVRAFKTVLSQSNGKPPLMCNLNASELPTVQMIPFVLRTESTCSNSKNKAGYHHL